MRHTRGAPPHTCPLPPRLVQWLHHCRHCPLLDEGDFRHRLLPLECGNDTQRVKPWVRSEHGLDRCAQRRLGLDHHRALGDSRGEFRAARERLHFRNLPCRAVHDDLRERVPLPRVDRELPLPLRHLKHRRERSAGALAGREAPLQGHRCSLQGPRAGGGCATDVFVVLRAPDQARDGPDEQDDTRHAPHALQTVAPHQVLPPVSGTLLVEGAYALPTLSYFTKTHVGCRSGNASSPIMCCACRVWLSTLALDRVARSYPRSAGKPRRAMPSSWMPTPVQRLEHRLHAHASV